MGLTTSKAPAAVELGGTSITAVLRRRVPAIAIAFAVLACSLSIGSGLSTDDWSLAMWARHRDAFPGGPSNRGAADLFLMFDGDPEHLRALIGHGVIPWTTDPQIRLRWFRPLASVTHHLDYTALSPEWMHVHSLAWFALALISAAWVFRNILRPGPAAIAAALYALDDAHGTAVEWLANRNVWMCAAFGFAAIAMHRRWAEHHRARDGLVAIALFAVALACGEPGMATAPYLLAHALWMERDPLRVRSLRLAAYVIPVIVWRAAYTLGGYGTEGMELYLDPSRDPLGFAAHAPGRVLALVVAQLGAPPAELLALSDSLPSGIAIASWSIGLAIALAITIFAWPAIREHAEARFLASGALLCAIPIAATMPTDRLLVFVGFGAMGVLAIALSQPAPTRTRRFLRGLCLVLHVVLAALALPVRAISMRGMEDAIARTDESIPSGEAARGRTVVLLAPPADLLLGYLRLRRAARGERTEDYALTWSGAAPRGMIVERPARDTLVLRAIEGFLVDPPERMLRDPRRRPFAVGDRVDAGAFHYEVRAVTADGRPAEVALRLEDDLDDPRVWLGAWDDGRFARIDPPPIGGRTEIRGQSLVEALLGG